MKRYLILQLLILGFLSAFAALSPQEVMRRSAAMLTNSSGVTLGFRISGQHATSGVIVLKGKRFFLDAGNSKVWYDGKVMTTLNRNTNEATVSNPSSAEVNQSCPLSYITGWQTDYTATFASKQPKGAYCIVLTARRTAALAKKAVLTVSSANFRPQKLVVSLKRGGTSSVSVISFAKGGNSRAGNFQFPKKQYPGVKVVDLR